MSQVVRQSTLFAGEDWRVFHKAFTEINFNAFDFDTIRAAMVDYIKINFPEDFNDFVESSEFIAILDLLAYLGGSLAFRMDINARENFIDSAERRDSILRLAKLISFQAQRNLAATGLVKIIKIQTDEDIIDSNSNDLNGIPVSWDDPNNPDWFEQFVLILNSAFLSTNPFGDPVKEGTVSGLKTQLFQLNNIPFSAGNIAFSAIANGVNQPFDIVNVDFDNDGLFFERNPNPNGSIFIIHSSDGNGNSSQKTGFFLLFKQGEFQFSDFNLVNPVENRVIDIDVDNINQTDVFVQQINDNGSVIQDWIKVPAVTGNNVIFNSVDKNIRNIFSVITRNNDQISIRFADGRFGEIPVGLFRIWYRVSSGTSDSIRPQDMNDITVGIPYNNLLGQTFNLNITFSLQETISNAAIAQTDEEIRNRAPELFQTQGRMVNGEDYNVFPLQSSLALKVKALNRTFSGHSRFIDINDPTSVRQDANVFADDGLIFKDVTNKLTTLSLPTSVTSIEIINTIIAPELIKTNIKNFYLDQFPKQNPIVNPFSIPGFILWEAASSSTFTSTGKFNRNSTTSTIGGSPVGGGIQIGVGSGGIPEDFIKIGSLLNFNIAGWVTVISIIDDGNGFQTSGEGKVKLNQNVSTNDWVKEIVPTFRSIFNSTEIIDIQSEIDQNNTFGVRYDISNLSWKIIKGENLGNINSSFSLQNEGDTSLTNKDDSWLIRADFSTNLYSFTFRTIKFLFESEKAVRFFFSNNLKTIDQITGLPNKDSITVLNINSKPGEILGKSLEKNKIWDTVDNVFLSDGSLEPRRIEISFSDKDDDGAPDNPKAFDETVIMNDLGNDIAIEKQYIFWKSNIDKDGISQLIPTNLVTSVAANENDTLYTLFLNINDVIFNANDLSFYKYLKTDVPAVFTTTGISPNFIKITDNTYVYKIGRKNLKFQWQHFAPVDQRIDPAITNIIDIFILDSNYDTLIRQWLDEDGELSVMPEPPSPAQLKLSFSEFEQFKMISDEIIWRPVTYKILFGRQAIEELRAKFKVTKILNVSVSDGEIKSQVISAINDFFLPQNWDFGETFYYTELAAFIHQRLPTLIASVVIVPEDQDSKFGELFQVKSNSNEIFISAARVSDVQIITNNTKTNLRIGM